MRIVLPCLFLLSLIGAIRPQQPAPAPTPQGSYAQVEEEAEDFYARKSFQRAYEIYLQAQSLELDVDQRKWVRFRLADTAWRAAAATQRSDESRLEQSQRQLLELVQGARDAVWAEACVSLGDFFWMRRNRANWHSAWPHYKNALDYWAQSQEIEQARSRYLGLLIRISEPTWGNRASYSYGHYGNYLPVDVLSSALALAQDASQKAHLNYLMASTLAAQGNQVQKRRAGKYFSAALEEGPGQLWYDDALFRYAQFLASVGKIRFSAGRWVNQPDYGQALHYYRRLVSEFDKGESRYYDDAQRLIQEIVSPRIQVAVSNIFLPDSKIQFQLSARNLEEVRFSLYRVDLTRDLALDASDGKARHNHSQWVQAIGHAGRQATHSWVSSIVPERDFEPVQRTESFDSRLAPGAYLLVARSRGLESRDLVLVSRSSLVMKTHRGQATAYFCNALDGSPIVNGAVSFWRYSQRRKEWQLISARTNQDGIATARFQVAGNSSYNYVATAASRDEQAFSVGWGYLQQAAKWNLYLVTDRPAYRPGDTVEWKLVARQRDGSGYTTPAHQTLEYEIRDPQGGEVARESVELNRFGSTWGSLELKEAFALGEYQIRVWDRGRSNHIGNETLFRVEEYKLPEFRVRVETPQENGRAKVYRIGEQVEIKLSAEYYFGGPLSGAEAEVIVYQRPLQHYWPSHGPFAWLKDSGRSMGRHHGGWRGQQVLRTTTQTDQSGNAVVSLQTDSAGLQDVEFDVEVRVRDASRREVVATGRVRVTRQRYFAHVRPKHHLHRPGDRVEVDFESLDANQQPFSAQAEVKVMRSHWEEIWIDPEGRPVVLADFERRGRVLDNGRMVPRPGWRLKSRGYRDEEVLTRSIRTDAQGKATLSFVADREGYFRVQWHGDVEEDFPVQASNQVWVTEGTTAQLGYRHGGVQVILDQDSIAPGRSATVMLSAQSSGRYVWFSVEADGLDSHQLVHIPGTARLIRLDLESRHIPNVFLKAVMVSDHQIFEDVKELIVPPEPNQVSVELVGHEPQYQPGEEGQLTVHTRNAQGEPVSAEVVVGVVDDSVYAIQSDYATDPLRHFFGRKRTLQVQTQSTFQQRAYLVSKDDKEFADRGALRDDMARGRGNYREMDAVVGGSRALAQVRSESRLAANEGFALNKMPAASPAPMESAEQSKVGQEPAIQVRSDFRSTIAWMPSVITDASGAALVPFRFSDSLTTWRATARAVAGDDLFGQGSATMVTNQPLMVRLQSPRFLQVGDTTTVSAIVNNNSERDARVRVNLGAEGVQVAGPSQQIVSVAAQGESRVDWTLDVETAGAVRLEVSARSSRANDAMERTLTAYPHGIEKLVATAGKSTREETAITLTLPPHREDDRRMTVQVTPSLAVTMLDALPYLIDYPYGCTEQTMSRFLPAAITAATLADLGLPADAIAGRIFGGIETEHADKTHTTGPSLDKMDEVISRSLARLYDFQHGDGGWGWWKEGDSDHFMTGYVVWGLQLAAQAGIEVKPDVLQRAATYLDREMVEAESDLDLQAWMLHALSYYRHSTGASHSAFQERAFDNMWRSRERLNAYGRAVLAMSAHFMGKATQASVLVENLENGAILDGNPSRSTFTGSASSASGNGLATAHWGDDGVRWHWAQGGVESTSFVLRALLLIDPDNALVDPTVQWLLKNRRGAQWSNTRDTAISVLALNDYLSASRELERGVSYEIHVNGTRVARRSLTTDRLLAAPSRFRIDPELLKVGENRIQLRRTDGEAPLYYMVEAEFFSLEEPIKSEGYEIFSSRTYYRMVAKPTLLKGHVLERQLLKDGDTVRSGDRLEVVVRVEAKNDYEYLVFEDLKAAGLEAVALKSGGAFFIREIKAAALEDEQTSGTVDSSVDQARYTHRSRWVHRELRDRKVALFVDKLPQGIWEMRYQLRAESPGTFHALPLLGHAMYVPEIRCNSDEARLQILDK